MAPADTLREQSDVSFTTSARTLAAASAEMATVADQLCCGSIASNMSRQDRLAREKSM